MADGKFLSRPREFAPYSGDLDQMFNRMMRSFAWPEAPATGEPRALRVFEHAPRVEVKENDKAYSVTAELPGLDDKDVTVQLEDDVLTISGEKKVEKTDDKTHYTERSYGSFTRAFTLPSDADRKAIKAQFAKGVLTLEIPKATAPASKAQTIEVKSGG